MDMDIDFLERVLVQHKHQSCQIHITDEESRILVSTSELRIGSQSKTAMYVIQIGRPTTIDSQMQEENVRSFCTPIFLGEILQGSVVVKGPITLIEHIGNTIKSSLETALEYERYIRKEYSGQNERNLLGKLLLQPHQDSDKLISMMNRLEIDPSLLRCVIYIDLLFHQTKYFSINLNLGYQSSIERIREEIGEMIQNNEYLNAEDLVVNFTNTSVVVIKSFIPVKDLSRIYLSLDVICESIGSMLIDQPAFSFHIAYGNLHYGVDAVYKSLQEAKDILHIGKISKNPSRFFNLESVLFEHICHHLQPQITNKLLQPALQHLREFDENGFKDILACAEACVDNNLNIAKTADFLHVHRNTVTTRLEKFTQITNIEPMKNFKDAFLVKLISIYQRIIEDSLDS